MSHNPNTMTTKPKYSGTRMDRDLRHALYLIVIFLYFAVRFLTSPIGGQNPNAPSASAAGWTATGGGL